MSIRKSVVVKKNNNRINQAVAILQQPFFEQIYYKFTICLRVVNQKLPRFC